MRRSMGSCGIAGEPVCFFVVKRFYFHRSRWRYDAKQHAFPLQKSHFARPDQIDTTHDS